MDMQMEQRSPEWFEARKGLVTGSAVGAILGLSPWQTRDDVLRRMVREAHGAESEQEENPAMAWGTRNEDGARLEFEMETGLTVAPASFVKHADGWLGASPDGYIGDDTLIEIKAPFSLRKSEAPVPFKPLSEQPHYAAQVNIQLHCTNRKRAAFFQWAPAGTSLEWMDRDDDWLNANLPILKQFWAEYCDAVEEPAEHLAPRRVVIDTPTAARMVREYDDLSEAIDNATERRKEVLASLVALAGDKDALVAGRKLTKVEREGAISYAKAVAVMAPGADLEKWRGKPSTSWRFT